MASELVAVADGVGGAAAGEVASRAVINALIHLDKCRLERPLPEALRAAVKEGDDAIAFIASCGRRCAAWPSALTAVALGDGYTVADVGDSRTYLLHDGRLRRLARDDSFVQALLDAGQLRPAGALRPPAAVGRAGCRSTATRPASPAVPPRGPRRADRLLLCSDGLTDLVDDGALATALALPVARALRRAPGRARPGGGRARQRLRDRRRRGACRSAPRGVGARPRPQVRLGGAEERGRAPRGPAAGAARRR